MGRSFDLTRTALAVLFIGSLAAVSFFVLQPFLGAFVWATTLVIATWPLMRRVERALGGRRYLAVAFMTFALAVVVLLPLSIALESIVKNADRILTLVAANPSVHIPPPPKAMADLPLAGAYVTEQWQRLSDSGGGSLAELVEPFVGSLTHWFVGVAGSLGTLFVHLMLTLALAVILYSTGDQAADWCRAFGRRLADRRGEEAVVLAGQAVRGVALGVVVTALAQTLVAGVGLAVAGVPQVWLLSAIMLLLGIAQLGPSFVLVPATIWLFATGATGHGILLGVIASLALTMDNLLRPFLIHREAQLPLPLVFAGVIGGLLAFGLLGLFLGPVVLAIAYTLLRNWVADDGGADADESPSSDVHSLSDARPLKARRR
jgi:predicted PurR-regulated permease PerM